MIGNNLDLNSIRTIDEINNLLLSSSFLYCTCTCSTEEVLTTMHKQWFSYKYSKYIAYITKDKENVEVDPQKIFYQIIDNIEYFYLIFFMISTLQLLNKIDYNQDKINRYQLAFDNLNSNDKGALEEITKKVFT